VDTIITLSLPSFWGPKDTRLTPNVRLKYSLTWKDIMLCYPHEPCPYLVSKSLFHFPEKLVLRLVSYHQNTIVAQTSRALPYTSTPLPCYTSIRLRSAHMSPHRSDSMEAQDNIRKRVCKACDRCRLKKSKVCSTWNCKILCLTVLSVMERVLAVAAKLTTPSVYSERGKSRKIKYIRKGTYQPCSRPSSD
jgi:hypothetical protein